MPSFSTLATLALAFAATLTNGHLILSSPYPYGLKANDPLNNSPLVDAKPGTGSSDYPCKQREGVYDIEVINYVKVGDPLELSFTGSASHGGGTCQLAITTDLTPSANTTFKLFQTFYNCPTDTSENSGTHPFTWDLPEGTPNGALTFAWLWYNKVGNRELYMNCAPIYVSGGSDTLDAYDALPNIYLINMPTEECSTVETTDQEIPHPGQYLLKDAATSIAAATGPSCAASAAAQTQGVSGYKNTISSNGAAGSAPAKNAITSVTTTAWPASTAAPSSAAGATGASSQSSMTSVTPATSATTSAPAAASNATASGGEIGSSAYGSASATFLTIPTAATSSPAASSAYPTMAASSAAAGVAAPSGYSPSGAVSGGSSSGSSSSGMTCSSDGTQFGVNVNGKTVWRPVAAGTTCKNGQITKRSIRQPHVRRHARIAGHV